MLARLFVSCLFLLAVEAHPAAAKIQIRVLTSFNTDTDTLYRYATNKLHSHGTQPGDQLLLEGKRYALKTDTTVFYVGNNPARRLAYDTLRILRKGKAIFEKRFRLLTLPDPVAALGNITTEGATIDEILSAPWISIRYPGSSYKGPFFRIIGFEMITDSWILPNRGNGYLNAEQLGIIRGQRRGRKLSFAQIRATCPDCATRSMGDFEVHIR